MVEKVKFVSVTRVIDDHKDLHYKDNEILKSYAWEQ